MLNSLAKAFIAVILLSITGCAGIEPPTPQEVLKHPLGTDSLKIGMSQQEVESHWGKPDEVNQVEDSSMGKGSREEWVYYGRYGAIVPIDTGYLSKTKHLYFDGNNLTHIKE